jgi:hypothetical protein
MTSTRHRRDLLAFEFTIENLSPILLILTKDFRPMISFRRCHGNLCREPQQSRQQHLLGWAAGLIPARIVQPMQAGKQTLE